MRPTPPPTRRSQSRAGRAEGAPTHRTAPATSCDGSPPDALPRGEHASSAHHVPLRIRPITQADSAVGLPPGAYQWASLFSTFPPGHKAQARLAGRLLRLTERGEGARGVRSELDWDTWGLVGIVASSKRLWPKVGGRNMASKTRPPAGERVAPAAGRRHAPYQRQRSSNWRCESRAAVSPEAPTRRIRRAARSIKGTAVAAPQPRQPSRAERVLGRLLKAPTTNASGGDFRPVSISAPRSLLRI